VAPRPQPTSRSKRGATVWYKARPVSSPSHLFAFLARMRFIRRWGLMHNTYPENVQEHTLRVALIAHALGVIRNRRFGGSVDPDRAAALALYHDVAEVFTGDLPSPVKHSSDEVRRAIGAIEGAAAERLLEMVPEELRPDFRPLLFPQDADAAGWELVKAADKLCAYLKCLEEQGAGNPEFRRAERALRTAVEETDLPEVRYFLDTFVPSFRLTLDDLG
jgi:5'-deoxynucleotidase